MQKLSDLLVNGKRRMECANSELQAGEMSIVKILRGASKIAVSIAT